MERITLFHNGLPVTHHPLRKGNFTIGSAPFNDLVLAGNGVSERHLTLQRSETGTWRAVWPEQSDQEEMEVEVGAGISLGPFTVAVEAEEQKQAALPVRTKAVEDEIFAELGWAGGSAALQQTRLETRMSAPLLAPVLITGESGTGKELVARALHKLSTRADGPFVAVNCGGFTESLLGDTLFGHERGAYTGAATSRRGVFQQADGGTLFMDEIGDLPLSSQASLLRVLDEKRVCPIGGEGSRSVNFRLVTATHRDLKQMIRKRTFRLDLYHRISTLTIRTFSLREHIEDLADIATAYFRQVRGELGERTISPDALRKLASYRWPGNVRELRNVLYRAAALCPRAVIEPMDIDIPHTMPQKTQNNLTKISRKHLARILEMHNGNVAAAARTLGVPRTSLRDRLLRSDELSEVTELAG